VVIDPISDERGELVGFAKVTRDITERRRAQDEIARSREALARAHKMEAIGRLTGGVAHDFNNLLTVIGASAEFLLRPNLDEKKRMLYAPAIADTSKRAAILTSQLLAFSRRQPLRPEVFDIGARLRGLQQIIDSTIGSSVAVDILLPESIQLIEADASQFETAVLNMVINARDAIGDNPAPPSTPPCASGWRFAPCSISNFAPRDAIWWWVRATKRRARPSRRIGRDSLPRLPRRPAAVAGQCVASPTVAKLGTNARAGRAYGTTFAGELGADFGAPARMVASGVPAYIHKISTNPSTNRSPSPSQTIGIDVALRWSRASTPVGGISSPPLCCGLPRHAWAFRRCMGSIRSAS
jgi:hypothetical protein